MTTVLTITQQVEFFNLTESALVHLYCRQMFTDPHQLVHLFWKTVNGGGCDEVNQEWLGKFYHDMGLKELSIDEQSTFEKRIQTIEDYELVSIHAGADRGENSSAIGLFANQVIETVDAKIATLNQCDTETKIYFIFDAFLSAYTSIQTIKVCYMRALCYLESRPHTVKDPSMDATVQLLNSLMKWVESLKQPRNQSYFAWLFEAIPKYYRQDDKLEKDRRAIYKQMASRYPDELVRLRGFLQRFCSLSSQKVPLLETLVSLLPDTVEGTSGFSVDLEKVQNFIKA